MFEKLTNQLRVFINEEVNKIPERKEKVEELNDNELFYKLISDHITDTAKGYADTLGLQYVGVSKETVQKWINAFFENFDERIQKAKEAKKKAKAKSKPKTKKNQEYKINDGLFGTEVIYKKKTYTKPEFEAIIKDEIKEDYKLVWEADKVIIDFNVEKVKIAPEKAEVNERKIGKITAHPNPTKEDDELLESGISLTELEETSDNIEAVHVDEPPTFEENEDEDDDFGGLF